MEALTSTLHILETSQEAVSVGRINPLAKPILQVRSGDEILLSTLGNWGGKVTPDISVEDFPAVKALFPDALGPHSLTGPIHVEDAAPGDSLVVELLEIVPEPHGYNMVVPSPRGRGVLRDRFPEGRITHFSLDRQTMSTRLNDRVSIPLRPFLGVIGVAPPGTEVISSVEPGLFGGNIDLSELVSGTRIELPVFHPGAGFYCGDGHSAQGDGEINQMAIETGMERVRVRLTLKKSTGLEAPRAESDSHWFTLGFGKSMEEAAREAVNSMVNFLAELYELSPEDSYTLCSISANLRVTQVVNGVVGMHVKMPKL
ncbi:acetamidase/formamidase family protein [Corynebacterium glutamicum]|uniref:acetamidase/formamidase family protein n=1 Tax=Corynebacterium glutamicum TaxID=1718 RepID=UPI000771FD29|nr:acetamidase/formamidase family protein [Corynebacterium glutamicum]AMK79442.1 hypothetical protein APT58_15210 [Corynebacterium glutamicum]